MSSSTMAKTVHLFHSDNKQLVKDFKIAPLESHNLILENIRNRLGVSFARVYTQDAKGTIDNLTNVHEGQILLVSSKPLQRPQPYSPSGFKLYRGEEAADLLPSQSKKPFDELTEQEKRDHIIMLKARKPETRNVLRIVTSYQAIITELDDLKTPDAARAASLYTVNASQQNIMRNWGLPFMLWLPENMKPSALTNYAWNPRMMATLSILAKSTPGQGNIVKELLVDAVGARVQQGGNQTHVPTEQDMLDVIKVIYERAGLIAQQLTANEKKKIKDRERKRAQRINKKQAARAQKDADEKEVLGPEAAEAAYLGKGKGKAVATDPDQLADDFKNISTSQPARRRPVIDSDEE